MQLTELHDVAQSVGVPHHQQMVNEDQLIHAIQKACNHAPCYRSDRRLTCKETDCLWKQDCKKLIAAWMR